jgi:hypothetical protein
MEKRPAQGIFSSTFFVLQDIAKGGRRKQYA